MTITDLVAPEAILPALKVNSKKQALQELAARASPKGKGPGIMLRQLAPVLRWSRSAPIRTQGVSPSPASCS